MGILPSRITWFIGLIVFLCISSLVASPWGTFESHQNKFLHLTFDAIPANKFSWKSGVLSIEVDKSSSLYFLPLPKIQLLNSLNFQFLTKGKIIGRTVHSERTKEGDDGYLRIGLLLHGDGAMVPFFAPKWVKMVRDHLKNPTEKILYLAASAASEPGSRWKNPYADDIESLVIPCKKNSQSWKHCEFNATKPLKVVGIWLLADGDNTGSTFKTQIKNFQIDFVN